MIVKMVGDVSGTRDGVPWPARGAEFDVGDDEGAALCASGLAKPVKDLREERAVPPMDEVETPEADVTPVADTAAPARRGRAKAN